MDRKYTIVIVGGKLQGVEAVYLARKAGFYSVLIDRNPLAPASALCDEFICGDVCSLEPEVREAFMNADLILPAMENDVTLAVLQGFGKAHPVKIAFDFNAYAITASKRYSDKLFHENRISAPAYYPDCKAPYIVKPSVSSGSTGVRSLQTEKEAADFLAHLQPDEEWIVQEQLAGPSYSIEIIGRPGAYRTYQVTEIHMDDIYDCNQVTCPCPITEKQKRAFEDTAVKIAETIGLYGIMDLEVIDDNGVFKVLEIDARIPSQTPTAVLHSTGINLLSEIVDLFEDNWDEGTGSLPLNVQAERFVSYEHYHISEGKLQSPGEHIMGAAGPLKLYTDYLAADEVLTDYREGDQILRGTFVNSGTTSQELEAKRISMCNELKALIG